MWKSIKTASRPCVRCKESFLIFNRSKWLCKDCDLEDKRHRRGDLQSLFLEIWKERPHLCSECGKRLGEDPLPIFFSHIKSRGAHPELKMDKNNIELLCSACHRWRDFHEKEK